MLGVRLCEPSALKWANRSFDSAFGSAQDDDSESSFFGEKQVRQAQGKMGVGGQVSR